MAIKHTIRADRSGNTKEVSLTPIKAIRFHCIECFGFKIKEVPGCTSPLCALYPYRMGKAHTGKKGVLKNLLEIATQKAVSAVNS